LLPFKSALPLVLEEPETVNWYGWQIGSSTLESLILLKLKKEKAHLAGKT
jgi:hypothetical protein